MMSPLCLRFDPLFALHFARPWWLLGLAIPLMLLGFAWMRTGRETALPFDHGVQGDGRWLRRLVNLGESLPALLLAVVIMILAGPQHMGVPEKRRALTNIEFCVDVSGSMTSDFGDGTRYDASLKAIEDFVAMRENDAFGLTFFSDNVIKWVPLTSDASAFSCALPFMNPSNPNLPPGMGSGTMIAKGLEYCRNELLRHEKGDRMIILVSDGASFDLSGGNDTRIAKKCIADGIVIYGIHISTRNVPEEVVNVTTLTGGEVFNPGDPGALDRVFRRIDSMQKAELESGSAQIIDFFKPFCATALGLVGTCMLCLMGLRFTPW